MKSRLRPVFLFGPTASGKTSLAIKLAQALGGEIINADSMQVYSGLPILTSQPSYEQQEGVVHHLLGTWDGAQWGTVSRWRQEAEQAVTALLAAKKWPLLVGGTGLYHQAFVHGLSPIPAVDPQIETDMRVMADQHGSEVLYDLLRREDPLALDHIMPGDRQRLVRAASLWRSHGISYAVLRNLPREGGWDDTLTIVLDPPRQALYKTINQRFEMMVQQGAIQEVEALLARKLNPQQPVMKAIGVKPLSKSINGHISLTDAIIQGQQDSRRYAKRQYTWAHNQIDKAVVVSSDSNRMNETLDLIRSRIEMKTLG